MKIKVLLKMKIDIYFIKFKLMKILILKFELNLNFLLNYYYFDQLAL